LANHLAKTQRRNIPLNALRSFEATARHMSLLKAAAELYVTPAAVSHQIKRLEEFLDTALFVREHRSVRLTPAGKAFADDLSTVFAQLEQAVHQVSSLPASVVRVSTMESLAAKWLAPRLSAFQRRHPSFRLRLETTDERVNLARDGIDVAIRYGTGRYSGVDVEHLMDAPAFPVCSPKLCGRKDFALGKLKKFTLLHDETSLGRANVPAWPSWLRANAVKNFDASEGPVFASLYLAQEAAIAGHGIALGLGPLVEADLEAGRLVRPFPGVVENAYAFWLVRRKGEKRAAVLAFCDWLKEEARRTACRL
jgi:LysR family transcriptional regulator, glycine cleavage system transcriptional activator